MIHYKKNAKALEDLQAKYDDLTAKFEAMIKWSNHTTETVSSIEKWSEHTTQTVTKVEESTSAINESISKLEEGAVAKQEELNKKEINENKIADFKQGIFDKLETIIETKEQGGSDDKSLNESSTEKIEENEAPLFMQHMPAKYSETWKGLDESEKERITKRANLFNFVTESSIKDFWNNQFTKENLIREEKTETGDEPTLDQITEARLAKLRGFKMV